MQSYSLGVEGHYSLELVECLLSDFGVDTEGLKLSRVVRTGWSGRRLAYVSAVGPAEAMVSLDRNKKVLEGRGWRVGWGDRAALGNGFGVGVPGGNQPLAKDFDRPEQRMYRKSKVGFYLRSRDS